MVINEVEVDPQLPHTLKSFSELQTVKRKKKKVGLSLIIQLHVFPILYNFSILPFLLSKVKCYVVNLGIDCSLRYQDTNSEMYISGNKKDCLCI